jgi:nitrate/nitrite transporter NarK
MNKPYLRGSLRPSAVRIQIMRSRARMGIERGELSGNLRILAGGFIAFCLLHVLNNSYSTVVALIKEELSLSYTMSGALMSAYFTGYTIGQIPWGTLADRYGPRRVMAASILGTASATVLFGMANSFWQILVTRFLSGLLGAGVFVPGVKLVSAWFSPGSRGTALGVVSVGGSIGLVIASWLTPYTALSMGWRGAMTASGVIGILSSAAILLSLRDRRVEAQPEERSLNVSEVVRTRNFWALAWIQMVRLGSNYAFIAWLPLILTEELGLGLVAAGAVFALYNLTGMISNPLGGIISDRFGEKEVLTVSFAVLCVATYLFARASSPLMIYATVLLIGWFINFVRSPNFAIIPKLYGVDNAGRISGVQNTFASLGALVLPLFLGFLKDTTDSYWSGWLILSGVLLSVSLVSLLISVPDGTDKRGSY